MVHTGRYLLWRRTEPVYHCQNNPILNHDPTGHGTKENSPYSKKEQQYIDAGADPDKPDWQHSVTRMQTRNRTYTISTRVRDIMQQMRRSWQTMRLSMVRRGQRTMLPTM
jgi:hypothetical protein